MLTYCLSLEDIMIFDAFEIHLKIIMQYLYCVLHMERHKNLYSQIHVCRDFSASQPDSYFGCMSWNQNSIIKVWIMLDEWEFWAWLYHIVHGFYLPHNKPIVILSLLKILSLLYKHFVCFCVLSRQIPGIWLWTHEEHGTLWTVWTSRLQCEEYHCTHIIAVWHRRFSCQSWGELGVSF